MKTVLYYTVVAFGGILAAFGLGVILCYILVSAGVQ